MPEFLVVHLGTYEVGQLREEQGCPAAQAIVLDTKDEVEAMKEASIVFRAFSPVGRCVALPFKGHVEKVASDSRAVTFRDPG